MIGNNADFIQMNTDAIKQYHNTNRYQNVTTIQNAYLQSMLTKMSTEDTDMLNSKQVDIELNNPELWIKRKIRQLLRQAGNYVRG